MAELVVSNDDIIVTTSVMSKILGASSNNTVRNYANKGMPYIEKGKQKVFAVKECLFWAISNGYVKIPLDIEADIDVEELPPNVRKDLADAKTKEFNYDILTEKYVLRSDVVKDATKISISFRERLFSLPDRLASELASEENPKEITKILWREFRKLISDIVSEFVD